MSSNPMQTVITSAGSLRSQGFRRSGVGLQGVNFLYSVVGVRFKKAGKIYYFDPLDLPIEQESCVIVETARGVEYGKVVVGKKEVGEADVVLPLKRLSALLVIQMPA